MPPSCCLHLSWHLYLHKDKQTQEFFMRTDGGRLMIYLDCAATTPPFARKPLPFTSSLTWICTECQQPAWCRRKSKAHTEYCCEKITNIIGGEALASILAVSGGTESTFLAIQSLLTSPKRKRHFITTAMEHQSISQLRCFFGTAGIWCNSHWNLNEYGLYYWGNITSPYPAGNRSCIYSARKFFWNWLFSPFITCLHTCTIRDSSSLRRCSTFGKIPINTKLGSRCTLNVQP